MSDLLLTPSRRICVTEQAEQECGCPSWRGVLPTQESSCLLSRLKLDTLPDESISGLNYSTKAKGALVFSLLEKRRLAESQNKISLKQALIRWHTKISMEQRVSDAVHHVMLQGRVTPQIFFYRLLKHSRDATVAKKNIVIADKTQQWPQNKSSKAVQDLDRLVNKIRRRLQNQAFKAIQNKCRQQLAIQKCKKTYQAFDRLQYNLRKTFADFELFKIQSTTNQIQLKIESTNQVQVSQLFLPTISSQIPEITASAKQIFEDSELFRKDGSLDSINDRIHTMERYAQLLKIYQDTNSQLRQLKQTIKQSEEKHSETLLFFKSLKHENQRVSTILLVSKLKQLARKHLFPIFPNLRY